MKWPVYRSAIVAAWIIFALATDRMDWRIRIILVAAMLLQFLAGKLTMIEDEKS